MNDLTRPTGRHALNVGHLVMGLAFLGLFVVWAIVQSDVVEGSEVRWLLPVPWVLAGGVGLAVSTLGARRRYAPRAATADAHDPTDAHDPQTVTEHEETR